MCVQRVGYACLLCDRLCMQQYIHGAGQVPVSRAHAHTWWEASQYHGGSKTTSIPLVEVDYSAAGQQEGGGVEEFASAQVAMGQCYAHDQLKSYDAAAKCYRRAVTSGDHENIVLHKLAELYKIMKQDDAAFSCYKQNLEYIDQQNTSGQVLSLRGTASGSLCLCYQSLCACRV